MPDIDGYDYGTARAFPRHRGGIASVRVRGE